MDKLVSFIIIILCIYLSYEYCSIIEGQINKPALIFRKIEDEEIKNQISKLNG